jgi:hypothetical protein
MSGLVFNALAEPIVTVQKYCLSQVNLLFTEGGPGFKASFRTCHLAGFFFGVGSFSDGFADIALPPAHKAVCSFVPFCETRVRWPLSPLRERAGCAMAGDKLLEPRLISRIRAAPAAAVSHARSRGSGRLRGRSRL